LIAEAKEKLRQEDESLLVPNYVDAQFNEKLHTLLQAEERAISHVSVHQRNPLKFPQKKPAAKLPRRASEVYQEIILQCQAAAAEKEEAQKEADMQARVQEQAKEKAGRACTRQKTRGKVKKGANIHTTPFHQTGVEGAGVHSQEDGRRHTKGNKVVEEPECVEDERDNADDADGGGGSLSDLEMELELNMAQEDHEAAEEGQEREGDDAEMQGKERQVEGLAGGGLEGEAVDGAGEAVDGAGEAVDGAFERAAHAADASLAVTPVTAALANTPLSAAGRGRGGNGSCKRPPSTALSTEATCAASSAVTAQPAPAPALEHTEKSAPSKKRRRESGGLLALAERAQEIEVGVPAHEQPDAPQVGRGGGEAGRHSTGREGSEKEGGADTDGHQDRHDATSGGKAIMKDNAMMKGNAIPKASCTLPRLAVRPRQGVVVGARGGLRGRGRGRGKCMGKKVADEDDFVDMEAGLVRLEHSKRFFGSLVPAARSGGGGQEEKDASDEPSVAGGQDVTHPLHVIVAQPLHPRKRAAPHTSPPHTPCTPPSTPPFPPPSSPPFPPPLSPASLGVGHAEWGGGQGASRTSVGGGRGRGIGQKRQKLGNGHKCQKQAPSRVMSHTVVHAAQDGGHDVFQGDARGDARVVFRRDAPDVFQRDPAEMHPLHPLVRFPLCFF